jgi:hypothetical protein
VNAWLDYYGDLFKILSDEKYQDKKNQLKKDYQDLAKL